MTSDSTRSRRGVARSGGPDSGLRMRSRAPPPFFIHNGAPPGRWLAGDRRRRQLDGAPAPNPCQPATSPVHCRFERFQWVTASCKENRNSQALYTLTLRSRAKRGVSKGEGVSLRQRASFEALCLQQRAPRDEDGGKYAGRREPSLAVTMKPRFWRKSLKNKDSEFGFRSAGLGICSARLGFRSEKFGFRSGKFGNPSSRWRLGLYLA